MTTDMKDYRQNIEVCLIGPSGAGKTSLLATLHKTLQDHLPDAFHFEALQDDQAILLHRKYNELHEMARTPPLVVVRTAHRGSQTTADYGFGLGYREKGETLRPIAGVTFFDTPGLLTEQLASEVKERIAKADVILCAVDASVLMEASPPVANRHNGSFALHRLLSKELLDGGKNTRNRLVLFTLIKAETWVHDASDLERLRERFEESYAKTLKLFTPNGRWAAAYIPVETIGNVVVSHVERPKPGEERILFKRKPGAAFSPRGVQVPLLLALRFVVSEFLKNQNIAIKLLNWILGRYQDLIVEMEKLDPGAEAAARIKFYGNTKLLGTKPANGAPKGKT